LLEETLSETKSSTERPLVEISARSLGVLGISFKTAPISTHEQLAKRVTLEAIEDLAANEPGLVGSEIVLVSTCNRIEIYYYGDEFLLARSLRKLFAGENSSGSDLYHFTSDQATTHLFSVAAGLDSLVIGEVQILSQVNEAMKLSADRGLSAEVMSRLFSKAYKTALKVREQNPMFATCVNGSVSQAVLSLISKRYGSKKPNLLLIGSGKMIRLAISSIVRSDLGQVVVAARRKSVEGLKADSIVGIADIGNTIVAKRIDVVITATSSQEYILRAEDLESVHDPLLILDISMPRNIDPNIGGLKNVTLLNLDDLKDRIDNPADDILVSKIKKELSRGVTEFSSWLADYEEIVPLLSSMRKNVEAIRQEEVANTLSRMPNLSDSQRATIEKMSERLINRFLHEPTLRLKHLSRTEGNSNAKIYAAAITELFSSESTKDSKRESDG
jgi:glutamyl-tRNA reductase